MTKTVNVQELGAIKDGRFFYAPMVIPAPGFTCQYTTPDYFALELLAVHTFFTASAVAGNRLPFMQVSTQQQVLWVSNSSSGIAATQAKFSQFGQMQGALLNAGLAIQIPLPRLILPPGTLINCGMENVQLGDLFSACVVQGIVYPLA